MVPITTEHIHLNDLPTKDQLLRLVAAGLPMRTWTLGDLWEHMNQNYETVYEFDTTMSADELIEALVSAIELESMQRRKTQS
jgi:hypothetical protein